MCDADLERKANKALELVDGALSTARRPVPKFPGPTRQQVKAWQLTRAALLSTLCIDTALAVVRAKSQEERNRAVEHMDRQRHLIVAETPPWVVPFLVVELPLPTVTPFSKPRQCMKVGESMTIWEPR